MYKGNVEIRKCKKCGATYKQQRGTLAMKSKSFNICPYCGKTTVYDEEGNKQRHEEIEERFRNLYKVAKSYKQV